MVGLSPHRIDKSSRRRIVAAAQTVVRILKYRKEWSPVRHFLGNRRCHPYTEAYTEEMATWRADFFDDWDDASPPSRSIIISANSDDEVMEEAKAEMGDAVRLEFVVLNSAQHSGD
jgi:hypothetical protein